MRREAPEQPVLGLPGELVVVKKECKPPWMRKAGQYPPWWQLWEADRACSLAPVGGTAEEPEEQGAFPRAVPLPSGLLLVHCPLCCGSYS